MRAKEHGDSDGMAAVSRLQRAGNAIAREVRADSGSEVGDHVEVTIIPKVYAWTRPTGFSAADARCG